MGGLAFKTKGRPTPRMSPSVYAYMRYYTHDILLQYFVDVCTPVEGPGKDSHGDIDVLASRLRLEYDAEALVRRWRGKWKKQPAESTPEKKGLRAMCGLEERSPRVEEGFPIEGLDEKLGRQENVAELEAWERTKEKVLYKVYKDLYAVDKIGNGGRVGEMASISFCVPWPAHEEVQRWMQLGDGAKKLDQADKNDEFRPLYSTGEDYPSAEGSCWDERTEQWEAAPFSSNDAVIDKSDQQQLHSRSSSRPGAYIQIDLTIYHDPSALAWHSFQHAHGDLWNILGTIIRPFGLTVNDAGLHVRIQSLEHVDKKAALVHLSSSPSQVLEFLDLSYESWDLPFASEEELFRFAANSRFFCLQPPVEDEDQDGNQDTPREKDQEDPKNSLYDLSHSTTKIVQNLKHSDRRRISQRPLYKKWIEDFLPFEQLNPEYRRIAPSREMTREAAFFIFGPELKAVYDEKEAAFLLARHRVLVWNEWIKGSVPDVITGPVWKSCLCKGLKRCVLDGEFPEGVVPREDLVDEKGWFDEAAVRRFVQENWQFVGDVAWEAAKLKKREGSLFRRRRGSRGSERCQQK